MDFETYRGLVQRVLAEDIGSGDVTTEALVPEEERGKAEISARQRLVTAGLPLAAMVFGELDPSLAVELAVTSLCRAEISAFPRSSSGTRASVVTSPEPISSASTR